MSSSPTETPDRRDDAPDGRLGRRGHRRRVEEAASATGSRRRDHRLDLDRQDRHRRRGARERAVQEIAGRGRRDGRRRRRARADRDRRQARRGARLRGRASSGRHVGGRRSRWRRPATPASSRATRPASTPAPRSAARPAPAAPARRRYSPVVMRIAAEHGIDLEQVEGTGRGGRVRKQDVLAYLENGGGAAEPPMHIECPTSPTSRPRREAQPRFGQPAQPAAGAGERPAALAHAPVDRRARWSTRSRPRRRARRSSRPT